MLTNVVTRQLDIPGEPNEWIKLRMLSGKKLEEARTAKLESLASLIKAFGSARELQAQAPEQSSEDADPLATYDLDTLLRAGVIAWSYGVRLCPDSLAELDEDTRNWAAAEIVKLTIETQEQRKKA